MDLEAAKCMGGGSNNTLGIQGDVFAFVIINCGSYINSIDYGHL